MLLRFYLLGVPARLSFTLNTLELIIVPLAVLAMFAASFIAMFQNDFKRMLAYSSIAQIGYILLGIGLLTQTGLTAAIVHLFNHGITKAALFMGVGALVFAGRRLVVRPDRGAGQDDALDQLPAS